MDTITAVRTIRVIRKYADKPLTEEEVRFLADAARKTGSSKNVQDWDFITVRDRESLRRLGGTTQYAKHVPFAIYAPEVKKTFSHHAGSSLVSVVG